MEKEYNELKPLVGERSKENEKFKSDNQKLTQENKALEEENKGLETQLNELKSKSSTTSATPDPRRAAAEARANMLYIPLNKKLIEEMELLRQQLEELKRNK